MTKKILLALGCIIVLLTVLYVLKREFMSEKTEAIQTPTNSASYICDGNKKITADFYDGISKPAPSPDQPPIPGGSVKINLDDGRSLDLNQTISANGGRYANTDESFVFWDKGNGAMVLENGNQTNYTNCIIVAKNSESQNLPQTYANSKYGFSIRLPDGYTIDDTYSYQMTPTKTFNGVKFTVPETEATGTNLGSDTHIAIEKIDGSEKCSADMFLDDPSVVAKNVTDNGTDYSFATSTGAGAGNRYEETIYAQPTMNSCVAIRYFVHYGVFENYPAGSIKEFDRQKILTEFDSIRKTLTLI